MIDYNELLQIEENSFTIDELLKDYYEFFQLPMAVIDRNYEIKVHFFIEGADETYTSTIQRGSWSMELISIANLSFKDGEKYKILETINSKVRRLFYRLTLHDKVIGYLVLLEKQKNQFDNIDEMLLDHLCKSIIKILCLQSDEGQGFSQLNFWKALVNHTYARREIFLSKASEFKLPLTYNYRVLLLSLAKYDNHEENHLHNSLKAILRNFFCIVKENYVIVILDKDLTEYTITTLNEFLFQNQIYAILSSKIIDLYELDVIIDNLTKLFDYLIKVNDEYCLKYEEDNKLLVPLFNAPTTDVILNYINEKILEIYNYDRTNNTSLLETTYQYLLNNKSLSETSRIMFVHKNTVTYRLDRTKDLFDINFDNAENNLSFMYSASIIKYLDSIKCKALLDLKLFN